METREERLERRRRERAEQVAYKLEQEIAVWDPNSQANITADPFKTLFVARIVSNTIYIYIILYTWFVHTFSEIRDYVYVIPGIIQPYNILLGHAVCLSLQNKVTLFFFVLFINLKYTNNYMNDTSHFSRFNYYL